MRGAARLLRYVWTHPLNEHARLAALGRVLYWQLRSRAGAAAVPLPFVDRTRLLATRGMHGATGNWYCGLHEAAEMAFALHLLRPGDLFVDAGANIGSYTVLAAGAAGARVLAVEPVPQTFARLQANIRHNALDGRVRACAIGLWDAPGRLRFSTDRGTENRVVEAGDGTPVDVPVARLDDLLGNEAPLLIKIDVEGHELAVLRGAPRCLAEPRLQALIVETDAARGLADDVEVVRGVLADAGFRPFRYDFRARRLEPETADRRNVLMIRDAAWVADRLGQAPHFRLVNGWV